MKTALYSVNVNDYDTPNPAPNIKGLDCFMFTDDPNINAPGWQIVEIPKTEGCKLQRKIKILGHEVLDAYDVTVYVDANMVINSRFQSLLSSYRGGLVLGNHVRNCVYAEGLRVKEWGKADADKVNKQIAEYYENDFPINFGMWSTGIMIRDKSTRALCELWYSKLEQHTHRDQLSLPWALKETGAIPKVIRMSQFVKINKHKSKEPLKIFYSSPYDRDKNIGKANNDFIRLLPEDAWVVITDGDAMFLNPDYGTRIENIIRKYGNDYQLIGCLTNRIGSNHQCYEGKFSNDMDLRNHYHIAHNGLADDIKEGGVAGFCMIFSKDTWKKVGGFKEKSITADTEFNKSIKRMSGKCGVYQGLYMLHAYRLMEDDQKKAQHSIDHLR